MTETEKGSLPVSFFTDFQGGFDPLPFAFESSKRGRKEKEAMEAFSKDLSDVFDARMKDIFARAEETRELLKLPTYKAADVMYNRHESRAEELSAMMHEAIVSWRTRLEDVETSKNPMKKKRKKDN